MNRWEDTFFPDVGTLYLYDGKLYVCAWSSGKWTPSNPVNNSAWIKLKKELIPN